MDEAMFKHELIELELRSAWIADKDLIYKYEFDTIVPDLLGFEIKDDRAIILHEQPFPGEF